MATKKPIVKKAVTKKIAKKAVKKTVVKKVAKKPTKVIAKKPVPKEIDWSKVKSGTWCTASIEDTKVTGKIRKEGLRIYICQNKKAGSLCDNRLGFQYSWTIGEGSNAYMRSCRVTDLKLLDAKPKDYKHIPFKIVKPMRIAHYAVTFHEGYIMVGCTRVTNAEIKKVVAKLK